MDTDFPVSGALPVETGVIVESPRDQRVLEFLVANVGAAEVRAAVTKLAGNRKPYVSNVAKILGISIPSHVEATSRSDGRAKLAEIREILNKKLGRQ